MRRARSSTRVLATLGVFAASFGASRIAEAACPGAVDGFPYAVPISFDSGDARTQYLALVTIDTAAPVTANKLRSDGGDLRFTDSQCTALDFWVEKDTFNTAKTKVWVKVPNVPAGSSKIVAWYGSPAATRTNDVQLIFGSNIVALYTFTEGSGTVLHDRVGTFDMTLDAGITWQFGFRNAGGGLGALKGFDANARAKAATVPTLGTGDFTAMSIIRPDTFKDGQAVIGSYPGDHSAGWLLKLQGEPGQFKLLTNEGTYCQDTYDGAPAAVWTNLTVKREGGTHRAFVNGVSAVSVDSACTADTRNVDGPGPFELGSAYSGNSGSAFSGSIAFTAVFNNARSDADIAALNASMAVGAMIYPSAGPEATKLTAPTIRGATPGDKKIDFTVIPTGEAHSITEYAVTCQPNALSVTAAKATLTLTGLTNGTTYTCTAHTTNLFGTSPESGAVQITPRAPSDKPDGGTSDTTEPPGVAPASESSGSSSGGCSIFDSNGNAGYETLLALGVAFAAVTRRRKSRAS